MTTEKIEEKDSLHDRFWEEMRNFGIISTYLFFCFSILMLFRSSITGNSGVHELVLLAALGKSLIIGKFILIGEAAKVGTRVSAKSVLHRIVWKSLFFLVILIILTILEELIVGWFQDEGAAHVWAVFTAKSVLEIIAPSLVMLMVLIPLVCATELNRAMRPGKLKAVFLAAEKNSAGI